VYEGFASAEGEGSADHASARRANDGHREAVEDVQDGEVGVLAYMKGIVARIENTFKTTELAAEPRRHRRSRHLENYTTHSTVSGGIVAFKDTSSHPIYGGK
jgi:hypothetical protein